MSKLPKWAQQRLDTLERNAEFWKGRALAGPSDSDTFVNDRPAQKGAKVRFVIDPPSEGNRMGHYIEVRLDESNGRLVIHGVSTLCVLPSASNALYLTVVDR